MKIKFIVPLFLVVTLLFASNAFAAPSSYSDLDTNSPHYEAIMNLTERGLLQGYPDGTFKPNDPVNRVEALKLVLESLEIQTVESSSVGFPDVYADQWYYKYVATGVAYQFLEGYPDGTFKPDQTVNLAELLKMELGRVPFNASLWYKRGLDADPYADVPKDEWYAAYAQFAKDKNLVEADSSNKIYPATPLTRAEVAEFIHRALFVKENSLLEYDLDVVTVSSALHLLSIPVPAGFSFEGENQTSEFHLVSVDDEYYRFYFESDYSPNGTDCNSSEEEILTNYGQTLAVTLLYCGELSNRSGLLYAQDANNPDFTLSAMLGYGVEITNNYDKAIGILQNLRWQKTSALGQ